MEKSEIIDRQVRRQVNITDEDVERYYKLNSKNYRGNERARIRHILLSLPEKAPADQVAKCHGARLRRYIRELSPARTSPVWRANIPRARVRADGGEIGWVNQGYIDCRPRRSGI